MEFSLINLLLVLLVAWVTGALVNRLGYPSVLGELAAGIIFGPAIFGLIHGSAGIDVLAQVGVFLMMLYIGMEIDHRELQKSSWGGLLAAIGGFIVPFALGYYATIWYGEDPESALFVAIAVSVTSLATKSRILVDLRLIGTRIANVLFAGALISDTAAILIFSVVIGVAEAGNLQIAKLALLGGKAILFFGVTIFIGIKVFPYVGKKMTQSGFTKRTANFTVILMVALVFGEMAELAGLHSIIGAFLAGLFLREGVLMRKLSHEITSLVHDLSLGFLAPIFFVTAGFHVSLGVFQTDLSLMIIIIVLATLGKIFGTALFYIPSGKGWREGLTVGAGMNGRGAVEIIIAEIGLRMGLISQEIFSILVFMAFFTTATVPFFLKWTTEWLRSRGELAKSEDKRSGTIIIGAGPTSRKLAKLLSESEEVCLIDSNLDNCEDAKNEGLQAFHGNAIEEDIMENANAGEKRSMIAFTTNPEVNILAAQLAKEIYMVPEVFILLNPKDKKNFEGILENMEINTFNIGKFELADWDRAVANNKVSEEISNLEELKENSQTIQEPGDDVLPLIINRKGANSFFYSIKKLKAGDKVTGISFKGN